MNPLFIFGALAALFGVVIAMRRNDGENVSNTPANDPAPVLIPENPDVPVTAPPVTVNQPKRSADYSRFLDSFAKTPFYQDILAAEEKYSLPKNLLPRLLWTESRYNPDAVSPKGATGIAQFMPATAADFDFDPTDPRASIDASGKYLAQLHRSTGDWRDTLAAYNWGIGNLTRKGWDKAPRETIDYVDGIYADTDFGLT